MNVTPLRLPLSATSLDDVAAAVHTPTDRDRGCAVLLAGGAGGDLDAAPLVGLATTLAELGATVVRVNLPHHEAGRRAPKADRSVAPYAQLLEAARAEVAPGAVWLAGGKSYGGRVATLACAERRLAVAGLLLHGYPLHPPGKPDQLRVEHWPQIDVRTLFLQGERDTFGTPAELAGHVTKLPRRATVLPVTGGDHSLDVAGVHAADGVRRSATEVVAQLAEPIGTWLDEVLAEDGAR